ncbi:hypothetical protein KIL84_023511 [Mauremys mutica]|uniref:Uncharacterized protein n=1 Tax=Mauremys mutica TaxID=74926 RepID=A0A9D3WPX4_9SAUR|nr:hypothetical protein KIL84_023511 [Mauremys mutica]
MPCLEKWELGWGWQSSRGTLVGPKLKAGLGSDDTMLLCRVNLESVLSASLGSTCLRAGHTSFPFHRIQCFIDTCPWACCCAPGRDMDAQVHAAVLHKCSPRALHTPALHIYSRPPVPQAFACRSPAQVPQRSPHTSAPPCMHQTH